MPLAGRIRIIHADDRRMRNVTIMQRLHAWPPIATVIMASRTNGRSTAAHIASAIERSTLWGRPGFLIRRLHQIHTSLFLEETQAFDITPVQYSLMTALVEHGEVDQMTLALEIGLERTSVAEVIPRLESRGLLKRKQSAHDARAKLVRLTAKGRALVARMRPAVQRAHDRTLDDLPKSQRDLFLLYLIRLVERSNGRGSVPLRLR